MIDHKSRGATIKVQAAVGAIVRLAREIGLSSVSEGVSGRVMNASLIAASARFSSNVPVDAE